MGSADQLLGNRYELRGVLGRGGMAEVRDGWDVRLSRPVAVKLLYPGWSADADLRKRFEEEARAAAALNHPNVVAVHDSGEHHGTPFIVMERLPGRTLADDIAVGPMPQARVVALLGEILSALAAAHAVGILHRDIKPGNILIGASGHAKLADFGIAKSDGAVHTRTGQVLGTMAYLSPQRLAGRPAGVSDDLYAVGVLGYEALTGRRPFEHDNPAAMVHAILGQTPVPIAVARPDVDPAVAAALEMAMAREPAQRFPEATAMWAALSGQAPPTTRFAAARPATKVLTAPLPPLPAPPPAAFGPARRSHTRLVLGIAAVLATLVVGALLLVLSSSPDVAPRQVAPVTATSTPVTTVAPPTSMAPVQDETGPGHGKGHGKQKEHPNKKGKPHD
ncbi:serine/threonine protein kinase [Mycobacterium sp. 21AC1]|uniref:serine/threonine-protein kinase n=1 Tax=[Mycobacterium] appelbergii TaxID=2939269 RepID=UPI0029391A54|nr:serine/threonine-protein kinase [Mycobacterium sp. 21AC1]MDV3124058.1 serine/threonine protein kinase [Mycobacterium sp. 21AC1]